MKAPKEFSVDEVCLFLVSIDLGHMQYNFRGNGIDGDLLMTFTEEDYKTELGFSSLQAKKAMRSLESFSSSASSVSDERLAQLERENEELNNEVRDLRFALQQQQQQYQQPPPPQQYQQPPPPQQYHQQQPQSGIERRMERRQDRREDRREHGIIGGGMERRMERREDRRERRRF